jgi:hypothetical protein
MTLCSWSYQRASDGSSWDGQDTTRCGSSRVPLSADIKGNGNAKVCLLQKAISTTARSI